MMIGDIVKLKKNPKIVGVIRSYISENGYLKAIVRIPIKDDERGYYEIKVYENALEKVEKK